MPNNNMVCHVWTQIVTMLGSTLKRMIASFRSHNTWPFCRRCSVRGFFRFGWTLGFPPLAKKSWGRGGMQDSSNNTISHGTTISKCWKGDWVSYGRLHKLHIYRNTLIKTSWSVGKMCFERCLKCMYAMKKQYEYARHEETGHSHFSRVVQKGVNKGTKVGCKYEANEDTRNLPIPPLTSKWWYREILCYSINSAFPSPFLRTS